jgi:hypothetical protein
MEMSMSTVMVRLPGSPVDPEKVVAYEQRWMAQAKARLPWWRRYVLQQGEGRAKVSLTPLVET